ncbi:hypothetical protein M422DRAFT_266039 [Sphaerobolus stellatus SS14]|uniref:DUF6534 domain-containing protein n=1 Tax=Sphaerobolus stellatus (strain SS14) TaxID=990650 RepID=A0A0C9USM6_SPHS4|nr:hypothetical protein M422DRAFT_266039 [Sphaerobolus stellatus SS14]
MSTPAVPIPALDDTYGASYIGVLIATFLQGILTLQVFTYFENFPKDSWKLKLLVVFLWVVDLVHLIFITEATYRYFVSDWGNVASLGVSLWTYDAHLIPLAIATIGSQAFLIWRIHVFGRPHYLVLVFLSALCLAPFSINIFLSVNDLQASIIAARVSESETPQLLKNITPIVTSLFTLGVVSDLLIALILCYYLRRGNSDFTKTNSVISHIVRYTVTTGLSTTLFALGCLIAFLASPRSLIIVSMHFSLGRMYTNSVVATLNARHHLRSMMNNGPGVSIPNQRETSTNGISFLPPSVTASTIYRGRGARASGLEIFDNKEAINIYSSHVYDGSKPKTINQNFEEENMELQILPGKVMDGSTDEMMV